MRRKAILWFYCLDEEMNDLIFNGEISDFWGVLFVLTCLCCVCCPACDVSVGLPLVVRKGGNELPAKEMTFKQLPV